MFLAYRKSTNSHTANLQLEGTIIAPQNSGDWTRKDRWIVFSGIDGLILTGGGQIDGQGSVWWKACSVKVQKHAYNYMLLVLILFNSVFD